MAMLYINEYNRSDKTKNLAIDLDDRSGKFLFDLLLDPISNSMAKQGDDEWGRIISYGGILQKVNR